jgi:hypothetical protein
VTQSSHGSPLVRFLRDPSRALTHSLTALQHAALHLLPLAFAMCAVAVAFLVARLALPRVREQRLADGARLVELAVPPELDSDGALLLWSALHDLLRPRLARLLRGQPQIAWEVTADNGGSRFRLWIPGAVPPGLVERGLASAWPGIITESSAADDSAQATDGAGEEGHHAEGEAVRDDEQQVVAGEAVADPKGEADQQDERVGERESGRGAAPKQLPQLKHRGERHGDRPAGRGNAEDGGEHRASFGSDAFGRWAALPSRLERNARAAAADASTSASSDAEDER